MKFPLKRKMGQLKLPTQTLWYVFLCHWDAKTLTSWLMHGKRTDRASPVPLLVAWLLWSEASHLLCPQSLWSFCKHCLWSHPFIFLIILKFFLTVSKGCPIIFNVLNAFFQVVSFCFCAEVSGKYYSSTCIWIFCTREREVYTDILKIFQMAPQVCSVYMFIARNMTEKALQSLLAFFSYIFFFSKQLTSCFYHSFFSLKWITPKKIRSSRIQSCHSCIQLLLY